MASLKELTGSEYLSYSTAAQYLECGERFRLERITRSKREPTWWFIGGDTFHYATELLDLGIEKTSADAWAHAWAVKGQPFEGIDIQAGGRRTKENPKGEDEKWWKENGPLLAAKYCNWRTARKLAQWKLLDLDGSMGIEVPFRVNFGDVPVQGTIDRVWVNGQGDIIIVDYKTGYKPPTDATQLRIYAAALQKEYGLKVKSGGYYMARAGEIHQHLPFKDDTFEDIEKVFSKALTGIQAGHFPANISPKCDTCPVRESCPARDTKQTIIVAEIAIRTTIFEGPSTSA